MVKSGRREPLAEHGDSVGCGFQPGYVGLLQTRELERRAEMLEEKLRRCDLCPRRCGVDRTTGKTGYCRTGRNLRIAAINLHPWEEPPISGTTGSGTIFFSGCTLGCIFCQNYPISQLGAGREMDTVDLAEAMLRLQNKGAHNINLVTSTHQMAAFTGALALAARKGLRIPIVYNSSGYESLETLAILEDVIDIYLPDIKYSDPKISLKLSGAADYVDHNRKALLEMWRQVRGIRTGPEGIARRGMIVRHLVLPENLSQTEDCLSFLAKEIGPDVWVSLMNQYFPAHDGLKHPPLDRKASEEEYEAAFRVLTELGLMNGFVQDC